MAIAMGTKPRLATSAVMSTGRRRVRGSFADGRLQSHTFLSCKLRMKAIITRPLSTATPDKAMKPTPAEMDRRDVTQPQRGHTARQGERHAREHQQAILTSPNMAKSSTNTNSRATGTTMARRWEADCSCSNVPPQAVQ